MYIKGPPEDKGFMWCSNDTPAAQTMEIFVLAMGYDSSAYGFMQRRIQAAVRDRNGDNTNTGRRLRKDEEYVGLNA